jgi:hypothetical protein
MIENSFSLYPVFQLCLLCVSYCSGAPLETVAARNFCSALSTPFVALLKRIAFLAVENIVAESV